MQTNPADKSLIPIPYYDPNVSNISIPIPQEVAGRPNAELVFAANSQAAKMYRIDPRSVSVIKRSDDPLKDKGIRPGFIPESSPATVFTIQNGRVTHLQIQIPDREIYK